MPSPGLTAGRRTGCGETMNIMNQWICAGTCLLLAAVSGPAAAQVTLTTLANAGVILTDGASTVMIDGLVEKNYAIYGGLTPEQQAELRVASGVFDGVDLALVSHRHHEHNQPSAACRFLASSPETRFVSSTQVIDLVREKCRDMVTTQTRFRMIDPQYGQPETVSWRGGEVEVFPLSHGRGKAARLQNFGHLVHIGGMAVVHVGDAAMDPTDFRRAGLDQVKLDIALVPFWYFQPGPGADVVAAYLDATHKIALHIPPDEMAEVTAHIQANFPDVLVPQAPMEQVRFSPEPTSTVP
jgi:L-ascorbate metabolism protein UlaG (beta-lactamase superfamily)